jgi:hypothetical protein
MQEIRYRPWDKSGTLDGEISCVLFRCFEAGIVVKVSPTIGKLGGVNRPSQPVLSGFILQLCPSAERSNGRCSA